MSSLADLPRARKSILLVDDDEDTGALVAQYLSADYDVRTAADGMAGLAELERRLPDVVVTDVMMPRLDGYGMIARMRGRSGHHPPVIFLTGSEPLATEDADVAAGSTQFLTKPFDLTALVEKIERALATPMGRSVG